VAGATGAGGRSENEAVLKAEAAAGPLVGVPGTDRFYATRLSQLMHVELDEAEAAALWRSVERHRRVLREQLGRDVGQRVALLDYVVNVRPRVVEPMIVETARLAAIEHRAAVDGLTELYNRQHFESELARAAERCGRYHVPSSLLLLDLDGFKQVNDTLGHQVGDRVLQTVGDCVRRFVRVADVPCRYGGDEFAIILCDTPQPEALFVADRIRQAIEGLFELRAEEGRAMRVTASGGLATLPHDAGSASELLARADRALYRAKQAGGNQIASAARVLGPPPAAAF
jgi:diguanylate cyclase (GGDEF)-like protein